MSDETTENLTDNETHSASISNDLRAAFDAVESREAEAGSAESAPSSTTKPAASSNTNAAAASGEAAKVPALKKDLGQTEGKATTEKSGPSENPNPEIPAPISWTAEKRQAFATLPKDIQQYVVEREKESQRLISQKSEEYDRTIRHTKEVVSALEPYRQNFARRGISEGQAIQHLLQANDFLERNPEEAIRKLAELNGIDLGELAQQSDSVDPQIQHLKRELDELKGVYTQQQQQSEQQYLQQLDSYVQSFEAATDEEGNKRFPFVSDPAFESLMATEVTRLKQVNPHTPLNHLLTTAYENTVWLHPELREQEIKKRSGINEARRISEEKNRAAEARKRAVSVTGSPSGAAKPLSTGSLRGDLEAAFDALGR